MGCAGEFLQFGVGRCLKYGLTIVTIATQLVRIGYNDGRFISKILELDR